MISLSFLVHQLSISTPFSRDLIKKNYHISTLRNENLETKSIPPPRYHYTKIIGKMFKGILIKIAYKTEQIL